MTATIARLILAMLLLPATGGVFLLTFFATIARRGGGPPSIAALLLMWAIVYTFVFAYWLILWRSTVRWTRQRVVRTVIATLAALAAGAMFGMVCMMIARGIPPQIATLVGGGTVPIVWVLATVIIWRETAAERLARLGGGANGAGSGPTIICPLCGYNLAGLREARCPECGASFTLEELTAAQPAREARAAEL
jgi:hypothetical protein